MFFGLLTVPAELLSPWVYDLEDFILERLAAGLESFWALRKASLSLIFEAGVAWNPLPVMVFWNSAAPVVLISD